MDASRDNDLQAQLEAEALFQTLAEALKEEDEEKRFALTVESCKIMAKIIAFPRKIIKLYQQRDLFFYLILLEKTNERPMQILINTILDRLNVYPGFILCLIESFIQLSKIKETTNTKSNKNRANYADNLPELNDIIMPPMSKFLTKKCVEAKSQALEYLKKMMSNHLGLMANVNPKIDILRLAMFYVLNTESYKVCEKACEVLTLAIESDEHAVSLISNLEKAKGAIEFFRYGVDELKKAIHPNIDEYYNWRSTNRKRALSKARTRTFNFLSPTHSLVMDGSEYSPSIQRHESIPDEPDQMSEHLQEIERDDGETQDLKEIQEPLEKWLFETEEPLIQENIDAQRFFESKDNYELFFTFLFEPNIVEITATAYYDVEELTDKVQTNPYLSSFCEYFKSINIEYQDKIFLKDNIDHRSLFPHVFRAYRCMKVVLNQTNYDFIQRAFPLFLKEMFQRLYSVLKNVVPKVSLKLFIILIEHFLAIDPDHTISSMVQFNVLYWILPNIERPFVRDFLFKFINIPQNPYNLSLTNTMKIAKYLKHTDYFIELLYIMSEREYLLDLRKCELNYKPEKLTKVYELNSNNGKFSKKARHKGLKLELHTLQLHTDDPGTLVEHLKNIPADIDGVLAFLKQVQEKSQEKAPTQEKSSIEKSINIRFTSQDKSQDISDKKKDTIREERENILSEPNSDTGRASSTKPKIYPSLLESYARLESLKAKKTEGGPKASTRENRRQSRMSIVTGARETPKLNKMAHTMNTARTLDPDKVPDLLDLVVSTRETPLIIGRASVKIPNHGTGRSSSEQDKESAHEKIRESDASIDSVQNDNKEIKTHDSAAVLNRSSQSHRSEVPPIKNIQNFLDVPMPAQNSKKTDNSRLESNRTSVSKNNNTTKVVPAPTRSSSVPTLNASIVTARSQPSKIILNSFKLPKLYPYAAKLPPLNSQGQVKPKSAVNLSDPQDEDIALVLAEFVYYFIEDYLRGLEDSNLMNQIYTKHNPDLCLLQSVKGHRESLFFKIILENYLGRYPELRDAPDNTGVVCGKIVNMILKNLDKHESLAKIQLKIQTDCVEQFENICKIIINSFEWKAPGEHRVFLQNFVVHETLGYHRLMLLETFTRILENEIENPEALLDKVPESIWHALQIWFCELKHQNMYQNLFVRIHEKVLKNASEKLLLIILLKLNLLGALATAYQDVYVNGCWLKNLHIESFIVALKRVVKGIHLLEESRPGLIRVAEVLKNSTSWKVLFQILDPVYRLVVDEHDKTNASIKKGDRTIDSNKNYESSPKNKNELKALLNNKSALNRKASDTDLKRSKSTIKERPVAIKVRFLDSSAKK